MLIVLVLIEEEASPDEDHGGTVTRNYFRLVIFRVGRIPLKCGFNVRRVVISYCCPWYLLCLGLGLARYVDEECRTAMLALATNRIVRLTSIIGYLS